MEIYRLGGCAANRFCEFCQIPVVCESSNKEKSTPKTGGNKGFFGSAALDPRIFVKCLLRGCDRDLRTPEVMTYRHVAGVTSNV